jgi:heterotetrameric sarcosine oxidase gamma subunit
VADLEISPAPDACLALLIARRGVSAGSLEQRLGFALPAGPAFVENREGVVIGMGEGSWLLRRDGTSAEWAEELQRRAGGLASVSDVSGGYVLFRVAGPQAEMLLQRALPIDLDRSAFPPGAASVTFLDHFDVVVRRLDEGCFELALFRSYVESFRHWAESAVAFLRFGGPSRGKN